MRFEAVAGKIDGGLADQGPDLDRGFT